MRKEEEKEKASNFAEGALSIVSIIENKSRTIKKVYLQNENKIKNDRKIGFIYRTCRKEGIPFEICDEEFISANTTGYTHGGIIAEVGERSYKTPKEIFSVENGFVFMLDGVEDPYNFSYAIRSLFASGATGMIMDSRNWMSCAGVVIRGSAGTSEIIDCGIYEDKKELIALAKSKGYSVVCADEKTELAHTSPVLKRPLFLIIGGEKRGISAEFTALADSIVRIEYGRAFNGSLTAAAASAVLGFEVLRQNKN